MAPFLSVLLSVVFLALNIFAVCTKKDKHYLLASLGLILIALFHICFDQFFWTGLIYCASIPVITFNVWIKGYTIKSIIAAFGITPFTKRIIDDLYKYKPTMQSTNESYLTVYRVDLGPYRVRVKYSGNPFNYPTYSTEIDGCETPDDEINDRHLFYAFHKYYQEQEKAKFDTLKNNIINS